ncbi:hypothetical protein IV203_028983 [Nitzschia inconspicua]|uniref:Uncharacterized protein n=1 Tax=Nitzschia inconspicua TaxID=303405 RepID=A0A9K3Q095_9STRA|nr:hypothetical protein IV203_028983 [Nitzschia inconspicua]
MPLIDSLARLSCRKSRDQTSDAFQAFIIRFQGLPEKPSDVLHPSVTEDTLDSAVTTDSTVEGYYSMVTDDPDLLDCFVHLPAQQDVPFLMDYCTIAEAQARDAALTADAQAQPLKIQKKLLAPNTEVFCHMQVIGGPGRSIFHPACY